MSREAIVRAIGNLESAGVILLNHLHSLNAWDY